MRIGMFAWESLNSIAVGGVAVHVTELANALAMKGHEVHVFTRKGEWWQKEHEEINGVFEHRVVFGSDSDFIQYMDNMCNAMAGCFHFVEQKYGKFDILHGHDWHVVDALTNIKHSKNYNFLWSCHSTEWGRNGNNYNPSWFSRRISHREWLGGYESNQIITVSGVMKQELIHEYQIPERKINVIYNGISPKNFDLNVDPGRVKEKYFIHPLAPVVLFAGRLSYQKGPDLLLESVPDVLSDRPDTRFIFAGSGDMKNHLYKRASELGVVDKIRVLGFVPDDKLIELFKSCDLVCIPSRNEPFGIVVLEAWSAGKPVVATNVGGPSEIIENFVTGVKVYPNNPESIAWGIKYLINNPEEIKKISENSLKAVKEFTWDKIADKTLDVYKKLF